MKKIDGAFLHRLRGIRSGFRPAVTEGMVAFLTGIDQDKLHEIEVRRNEPYLDEAVRLAGVFRQPTIAPLISSHELTDPILDFGVSLPDDVGMLRAGMHLPLSVACRITLKLGLADPIQLVQRPIDMQAWALVLDRSDGWCPCCREDVAAGSSHLSTCLADILWGPRDLPRPAVAGPMLAKRPGKGRRASGRGWGIRTQRELRGMKQQDLAKAIGMGPQYLSKIETGRLPLTTDKSKVIAGILQCDEALLFVDPYAPGVV